MRVGWRTRLKWVVEGRAIGLYGRGTHAMLDLPHCLVAPEVGLRVAEALRRRPVEPLPNRARLGAVDVRVFADGMATVVLVIEANSPPDAVTTAQAIAQTLAAVDGVVGIGWSLRRPGAPTVLGGTPQPLVGTLTRPDTVGRVTTPTPPGAFVQAHRAQAGVLHDAVHRHVSLVAEAHALTLVDLYAGCGSLGLHVRDLVRDVVLVESFWPALDGLEAPPAGVRLHPGTAEQALRDGVGDANAWIALVDPPRTGLSPEVLTELMRRQPAAITYVSCDPETLARDLAMLAWQGYSASTVELIDLMPGTPEIESVVTLTRGPVPPLTIVSQQGDLFVVDKPPFVPATPHPEWPRSALDGTTGVQLAHRLDVGTSGLLALSARGSAALEGATKSYLALVMGLTRKHGTLREPLPERGTVHDAVTRYRRRAVIGGHSLVEVTLETGRTHQIRRHFAGIGHPVIGDVRYGDEKTNRYFFHRFGLTRTFLHAIRLDVAGMVAESALWPDLERVLAQLGAPNKKPAAT